MVEGHSQADKDVVDSSEPDARHLVHQKRHHVGETFLEAYRAPKYLSKVPFKLPGRLNTRLGPVLLIRSPEYTDGLSPLIIHLARHKGQVIHHPVQQSLVTSHDLPG